MGMVRIVTKAGAGVALLFILSQCASPAFVARQNTPVFVAENAVPVDPQQVEIQFETLILMLNEHNGLYTQAVLDTFFNNIHLEIEFIAQPVECPDGECEGYIEIRKRGDYKLVVYNKYECLAISYLIHELLHIVSIHFESTFDDNHENPNFWGLGETVEARAMWLACQLGCGDLCLGGPTYD